MTDTTDPANRAEIEMISRRIAKNALLVIAKLGKMQKIEEMK